MIDQIRGWLKGKTGEAYGDGFDLKRTAKPLSCIMD